MSTVYIVCARDITDNQRDIIRVYSSREDAEKHISSYGRIYANNLNSILVIETYNVHDQFDN